MVLKIKTKIDTSGLKRVIQKQNNLIQRNISAVLRKEAIPHLISLIMKGYDNLSRIANQGPDDPTNPANWRSEFLLKLQQDLEQNFSVAGNKVSIRLGDRTFLGYNASGSISPDDTEPLHWLVFYIEGLAGDIGIRS
jgi:hypothetical protein